MASSYDNEVKFALGCTDQVLQLLPADQFTIAFKCLKQKKVAFMLLLIMELSNVVKSVLNPVTREMNAQRLLPQNFLQALNSALLACNRDFCLTLCQLLFNYLELLPVVQLRHHLQLGLVVCCKTQHKRTSKHECKVQFLLLGFVLPQQTLDVLVLLHINSQKFIHLPDPVSLLFVKTYDSLSQYIC